LRDSLYRHPLWIEEQVGISFAEVKVRGLLYDWILRVFGNNCADLRWKSLKDIEQKIQL